MSSPRGFSLLLTASQTAARLGVPIQTVLGWAAAGELRIAGQDEDGRALFREAAIDSRGKELAEGDSRLRHTKQPHNVVSATARTPLPCGCDLERPLCRDGVALSTALQFAEFLTFVMPDDPLPRRLAEACRDALVRHWSSATSPTGDPARGIPFQTAAARQPEVAASGPPAPPRHKNRAGNGLNTNRARRWCDGLETNSGVRAPSEMLCRVLF